MSRTSRWPLAVAVLALAGVPAAAADPLLEQARQYFAPLPPHAESPENPITPEKIALGRTLYYDTRLSKGQDVSCNSCHRLEAYGVDGAKTAPGHGSPGGGRNAPSAYHAALQVAQLWDGRATTVEELAARDGAATLDVLASIPGYAPLFQAAFPGDPSPFQTRNVGAAIGAFQRTLVTPSRFDRWLGGDANALTAEEKKGLETFASTGCITCHDGVAVGGGSFQKLGLVEPYPSEDRGRAKVTGREQDQYVFKVPSLRNVAKTGPWLHDGSIDTLDMTVRVMARHQLGRTLTDVEAGSIVTFLNALTGEIPKDQVAPPALPPSGPGTPKPDPA